MVSNMVSNMVSSMNVANLIKCFYEHNREMAYDLRVQILDLIDNAQVGGSSNLTTHECSWDCKNACVDDLARSNHSRRLLLLLLLLMILFACYSCVVCRVFYFCFRFLYSVGLPWAHLRLKIVEPQDPVEFNNGRHIDQIPRTTRPKPPPSTSSSSSSASSQSSTTSTSASATGIDLSTGGMPMSNDLGAQNNNRRRRRPSRPSSADADMNDWINEAGGVVAE